MTTIAPDPVETPEPTLADALDHLVCTNYKQNLWQPLRDITAFWLKNYVELGKLCERSYPNQREYIRLGKMAAMVLAARGRLVP